MSRFRQTQTGVVFNVSDDKDERYAGELFERYDGDGSEPTSYAAMKVADLKAEIEKRNEGREEAELLPTEGKKADLIAVLEADDEDAESSTDE